MATVTNKSEYFLSIVGTIVRKGKPDERYRYRLPAPQPGKRGEIEVEDHHAKHWDKRTKYVEQGLVMIKYPPSRTVAHGTPSETPTEPALPHWRTALKSVGETSDLDALAAMHEADDRPKVREAIEERMAALR